MSLCKVLCHAIILVFVHVVSSFHKVAAWRNNRDSLLYVAALVKEMSALIMMDLFEMFMSSCSLWLDKLTFSVTMKINTDNVDDPVQMGHTLT